MTTIILGTIAVGLLIAHLVLRSRLKKEKASVKAAIKENKRLDSENFSLKGKLQTTEKELTLVNAEMTKLIKANQEEGKEALGTVIDSSVKLPFFEKFMDADDQFRWRFKAKNNKTIADSGEGYTTKQNLEKGMNSLVDAISSGEYRVKEKGM